MNSLKIVITAWIILLVPFTSFSQKRPAISGGLAFSSGSYFNSLATGNPALYVKVFIKTSEKFKIAPSITVYSPKKRYFPVASATQKNYMFQADVDGIYSLYRDHPLRVIGILGVNVTSILSNWDIPDTDVIQSKTGFGPGANLGIGVNMFVNNSVDAYASGKLIAGKYTQLVFNIGVIYYVEGLRRKGGW